MEEEGKMGAEVGKEGKGIPFAFHEPPILVLLYHLQLLYTYVQSLINS